MKVALTPVVLATVLSITGISHVAIASASSDVSRADNASLRVADSHETWTAGKVVRVSAARGKVTIAHGPIANLDMMAMTMPFTVADASMLDGLNKGDEIEFVATMEGGELTVVKMRRPAG